MGSIIDMLFGKPMEIISAHAALANKVTGHHEARRLSRFITVQTQSGEVLDNDKHFVVTVAGCSMEEKGIRDGDRLIARKVEPGEVDTIPEGSVVVVDGPAAYSDVRSRLRVLKGFDAGKALFEPYSQNKPPRDRPAADILGVITHSVR